MKEDKKGLQFHYLITNGYPSEDSVLNYTCNGWNVYHIGKANVFHPYALESDYITIFHKYVEL